jgi:hypothetical protein
MRNSKYTSLCYWLIAVLSIIAGLFIGNRVSHVVHASGIVQSAYNLIEDEASILARRTTLQFTGTGVTCSDANPITTCAIPGIPSGFYSQGFTTQTSVTLTHNLNTTVIIVQCYDGSTPRVNIEWDTLTLTDANNATVTFTNAQTGICYVNSQSGGTSSITKISGSASIAFSSSIADGGCFVGGTTITVTGANTGDPVIVGPSTALASKVESYGKTTGSNTVTVEVCNFSGGPVTPGTATYTAQVFH